MMLLGLCGLKGSGKDTVGAYLVKEHGFERKSFADKLKESVAALFDVEPWEIEQWKNDPGAYACILSVKGEVTPGLTIRQFLQRYGTEAHRDVFGQDFWVNQLLPMGGYYSGRNIVVTDVRFKNEIDRILTLDGHVIYVDRPALDQKDPHRSEEEVSYGKEIGYQLVNNLGVMELYEEIEDMLVVLGESRM